MIELPRIYNASRMIDDQIRAGRGESLAIVEARAGGRRFTYAELGARMNRAGNMLRGLGVEAEQRLIMCMLDTADFPAVFFGAMKIGAVPIPVNTLLTSADYDFLLEDSRARVLIVSGALYEKFRPILGGKPHLKHVIIAQPLEGAGAGAHVLEPLLEAASPVLDAAPTCADEVAFWLYSSGSTGKPKGAMHLHAHIPRTAEMYGNAVLGVRPDDVLFSAAKLFFAYGLGNGMSFPFHAGATAVLLEERPSPASVLRVMREFSPTIYFGVPTLFASILASPESEQAKFPRLRMSVSAGEALPRDVEARWRARFGTGIIDGLGSTEMLHIFLNEGKPVPGYSLEIVDPDDRPVKRGEIGELKVSGPTSAIGYWNQREKSRQTFRGPWTMTGDEYLQAEDGTFVYCGRHDDMIKSGGIWVSPAEIEATLIAHASVLEAAVVGAPDENQLHKPKAFVVLRENITASTELAGELQSWVRSHLAHYKTPRWIEFLEALPKTATGKIQRFKLRDPRP